MSPVDPPVFSVSSTPNGSALLVEVVGEVDISTAPELSKVIDLTPEGTTLVVVDLSGVVFLDSSGLNALVRARRALLERDVAMRVVVPVGAAIRRVFEITRLTEPLTVIDARPSLI